MNTVLKPLALILLVGFIGLATSWADVPKVQYKAPTFTLPDVSGKQVHLSDFKNKKNVILVFYRGWVGEAPAEPKKWLGGS